MEKYKSKNGVVKIFTDNVESLAMEQIVNMANSILGKNSHIRIMPDVHAGKGCVIGTTMRITDKVCPNLVGVDIGCGVDLVKTNIDFSKNFEELDKIIRKDIPFGQNNNSKEVYYDFSDLLCYGKLKKETRRLSKFSLGSLGGGNHFIEAYDNGYLAVHSGSRNIGYKVAEYYQTMANDSFMQRQKSYFKEILPTISEKKRQEWVNKNKQFNNELAYLTSVNMKNYLHDVDVMQKFAVANRKEILNKIVQNLNGEIIDSITSIHNYIDVENKILRKGAISARLGEMLVIPLNMRDGLLLCRGKGNFDWNFSAPHGAGRLYSRTMAKKVISLNDFRASMTGIFSTCIGNDTLDESPFAYKNYMDIMQNITPTVEIIDRLIPIYNFKAGS